MKIDGFDWDKGNVEKNFLKHGITCEQIEKIFHHSPWVAPDVKHSSIEERFLAIGRISGRRAFVSFAIRIRENKTLIRPISACFMHAKEVKKYEKEITENNDR